MDFERTHFANQIGHSSYLRWSRSDSCYPPFGLGWEYLVVIFIVRGCHRRRGDWSPCQQRKLCLLCRCHWLHHRTWHGPLTDNKVDWAEHCHSDTEIPHFSTCQDKQPVSTSYSVRQPSASCTNRLQRRLSWWLQGEVNARCPQRRSRPRGGCHKLINCLW